MAYNKLIDTSRRYRTMHFVRVTSAADSMYPAAMALYAQSFPAHEQRAAVSQAAVLHNAAYHFTLLFDGAAFVGILLYWDAGRFLYVEHFCICPELRGRQYGQRTLALLHKQADRDGKTVILEIDPPVDAVSIRRKGFYERAQYHANAFAHIHPPYHRENSGHALVVMSYPAPLTEAAYQDFSRYLRDTVMAHAVSAFQVLRAAETWQQAGAYYVRIQAMAKQHHITLREEFDAHDTPDTKYIVLLDGDFPVATCRLYELTPERAMLGRVVVLPEYRGQQLGRRVVLEAEAWLRELGYQKSVLESRDVAVGFYEKLGYTADRSRIIHGPTFTCVYMEKSLLQNDKSAVII